jgi:hypothetical protein
MAKKVFALKIELVESKPMIGRIIIVKPGTLLVDLHRIIQTAMGWTNSHLHQFFNGEMYYALQEFEIEECENSRDIKLNKILFEEGMHIEYEYDFGDGWQHDIWLQNIYEENADSQVPRCIGGMRSAPPEDCGGIHGYKELLKILSNTRHKEYKETREWVGDTFDPEYFNITEINKNLKKKDFGCIWL